MRRDEFPVIEVRGVLRSWDTARRRFERRASRWAFITAFCLSLLITSLSSVIPHSESIARRRFLSKAPSSPFPSMARAASARGAFSPRTA